MRRVDTPTDISLDSLAVRTCRLVPSGSLLVGMEGMERRLLSWHGWLLTYYQRTHVMALNIRPDDLR